MGALTCFSNRIYKNTLSTNDVTAIGNVLVTFNRAKHFAFGTMVKEKRSGISRRAESMHKTVKERFGLDDYYANSAVQEAKAKMNSLTELNKLYIANKKEQIKAIKKKLKKHV